MAADGDLRQEDGGDSESSESSGSTSSASPCPPSTAAAHPLPLPYLPPLPASSSASAPTAAAPSLPLPPHLYYQQRHVSLHLSPAATPASASQPRGTSSEASLVPPSDRPSRDDCWSENATLSLIQAWGDRYLELNRGNLKQKHWKEVADCVNSRPLHSSKPPKTDIQCKNRIDTLKKKYKIERSKLVSTGGAPKKWAFFDRLDELIGSSKKPKNSSSGKVSRAATAVADADCTSNPDGHCTDMPAAKGTMEEDVKPPLFFIPPQATIAVPPPLMNHHVGGVVVHMNHHVGNLLHLNPHVGPPIIHHLTGEGAHINHHAGLPTNFLPVSMAGPTAVNYQVGNGGGGGAGGGLAATDTGSKSKAGAEASPSSPPHKRSVDKRRRKRKRHGLSPNEDDSFRELAKAISKFGDVYERIEIAKLQQATALEKQRRELAKDLEIQRMQLFMQMQIERVKTKYGSSKPSNTEEHS